MSNQLDVPSVDMLAELKEELKRRDIEMWLARLHGPVREPSNAAASFTRSVKKTSIPGCWKALWSIWHREGGQF